MPGPATSAVEATNISRHGFWMLLDGRELFLPFTEFPWFEQATVAAIYQVERPQPHHLYWPLLDVDLAVDSIEHPERYPLLESPRKVEADHKNGPRATQGEPPSPDGALVAFPAALVIDPSRIAVSSRSLKGQLPRHAQPRCSASPAPQGGRVVQRVH